MQVEYKRNLQNNYLVLGVEEETEEDYCLHMAETNNISGLLPFQSVRTDGRLFLQYEITSKQSLEQLYGKRQLSGEQMNKILTELSEMLEAIQKYLLNPVHILFDPQYIFVSAGDQSLQFCYLPEKNPKGTILPLAEFFLKHLNHEDFQAVEMGYQFYQQVLEENLSLRKILKEIIHKEFANREILNNDFVYKEGSNKELENKEYANKEYANKEYANKEYANRETLRKENLDKKYSSAEKEKSYLNERIPERQKNAAEESQDDDYNVYKVTHKERKKENKLFQVIHPAVLISALFLFAVIEILYYFQWINLTEAGGMFFLLISVELLGNQLWSKRRKRQEEQEIRWISEEEDAVYRMLQDEMYEEYRNDEKQRTQEPQDEEPGETRYLGKTEARTELRLIPAAGKESGKWKFGYQEIVVREEAVLIGKRKGESDVILDSPTVSRTHALLERKGSSYYVCDLNSKNGTFCNGERILPQEKRKIENEDLISFAELEYRAVIYSESDET